MSSSSSRRWFSTSDSRQPAGPWRSEVRTRKINESLYELEEPEPPVTPNMVILFFHGFQSMDSLDMHLETWESEDRSCIWPNEWLTKKFPRARILYVSYSALLQEKSPDVDINIVGENLVGDFLQANIGQTPNCPVILVGHCFGGFVIKQVCLHISNKIRLTTFEIRKIALENFLSRVKGIFYYGTPHKGSPCLDNVRDLRHNPLLGYFKVLNNEASRLNSNFSQLCSAASWQIQGLGESMQTDQGIFRGVVAPEACSRDGDEYYVVQADHVSISKPESETDRRFYALSNLLSSVVNSMKVEEPGHQCQGLPDHAVELEKRAKEVQEKLKDVGVLGICGMGGIGKTTLAKYVYNYISKDFEYTCFVEHVKGIQTQLGESVLSNFYQRGRKVKRTQWSDVKEKQALIVMDDIDLEDKLRVLPKLQEFKSGSRIIITTRNKDVLKVYESHGTYDVDFLKVDEGRKLFCQHAFGEEDIPDHVRGINHLNNNVPRVVDKCGGLPLTLEVMGRHLRGYEGNPMVWEQTIDKLGKAQAVGGNRNDRVWASLKVSYDVLLEEEQEMFIEAGAFFSGNSLERALAAWSTKISNPETRWANLVNRSMVKEVHKQKEWYDPEFYKFQIDYKEVWVHEQLRDLAKSLAKEEMKSGSEELVITLNADELKKETKALQLRFASTTIRLHSLAKLEKLRYLAVYNCDLEGWGKNFPRKFSMMRWKNSPSYNMRLFPFTIDQWPDLALLELEHLCIPKGFLEALGRLTQLRILSLVSVTDLGTLPENFGKLYQLKRMHLDSLRISKFPDSLGNLLALEHLTLKRVHCLELPVSFGDLRSLVTLTIFSCSKLASLPSSFGRNLGSLTHLKIIWCPLLEHLPKSFSQLRALQVFILRHCKCMRELGDSFGDLPALQRLVLEHSSIKKLPANFGLLSTLRELVLMDFTLTVLPNDIDRLTALTILRITARNLKMLPESLGRLSSLEQLEITECYQLEMLPKNLGLLSSLEQLEITECHKLEMLPENLGQLTRVKKVFLGVSSVILGKLPSELKELRISARSLEILPSSVEQRSSLRHLDICCDSLEPLPNQLGKLSLLEELKIKAESLKNLPESIGQFQSLRKLILANCRSLEDLPNQLGELSLLEKLEISAKRLKKLPESIGLLSSLKHLTLAVDSLRSLPKSVGRLSSLQEVVLLCDECERLPNNFDHLPLASIALTLRGNNKILPEGLCNLSTLGDLTLRLWDLEKIPEELGKLSSLRRLHILSSQLKWLPDSLGSISSLKEVRLECRRVSSLPDSLGRPSSCPMILSQGEKRAEIWLVEKPSPQPTDAKGLCLIMGYNGLLDEPVMRSLGWVREGGHNEHWPDRWYRRVIEC